MMNPNITTILLLKKKRKTQSSTFNIKYSLAPTSGGLSQDFAESGQNRVTAKNQVRAGSSHSAARTITVAKFN